MVLEAFEKVKAERKKLVSKPGDRNKFAIVTFEDADDRNWFLKKLQASGFTQLC